MGATGEAAMIDVQVVPVEHTPKVSIILPTYNRARFLPEAFASISSQTFEDWELVIVDDGSTDETARVMGGLARAVRQPVRYERQSNQGAYGARNTGLDLASGMYIAFFDSDDIWLPHHLERCVSALDRVPSLDWVYAACRTIDETTGEVLHSTTFEVDGRPRPFLKLQVRRDGDLYVFDDPQLLTYQIEHGLYAGLQNSVIRREVFAGRRFWSDYRVVEDVLFLVRSLASGTRLGYYPDVHVVYSVHHDNSSASAAGGTMDRFIPIFEEQVRGFERLRTECELPAGAARALRRQLAEMYFWRLGYTGYWSTGRRASALAAFEAALKLRPVNLSMWKTYLLCRLRGMVPDSLMKTVWYLTDSDYRRGTRRIHGLERARRAAAPVIWKQTGGKIASGPFAGMTYLLSSGPHQFTQKLLGTYEKELAGIIDEVCKVGYRSVVDIGAAEGYYASGLAYRIRHARVWAFETESRLHAALREIAEANGLLDRIEILGRCDAVGLRRTLAAAGKSLLVCDVEGAELDLLDPATVPELAMADILVEVHDGRHPGVGQTLRERFQATHEVSSVSPARRVAADLPDAVVLERSVAEQVMDECRGISTGWLWMRRR